jgi:hypothetical protein
MRFAFFAVAFCKIWSVSSLVSEYSLNFLSLSDGEVITTSTSYVVTVTPPPSPLGHPSSFKINSAALAYPTFTTVPLNVAISSPGPGLPDSTTLTDEAVALIELRGVANATNCAFCKQVFTSLAARMRVQQETLAVISQPFCQVFEDAGIIPMAQCVGLLNLGSTDIGAIFPAMNMAGDDGQLLCAYMFGACLLPPVPELDLVTLFKGTTKPPPKKLISGKKDPLKVLHFSDYHLDLRYVVGSEANCGGDLCCRVFPGDNTSEPINTPASLFGNYLCDTPEALGTSVFRAVPSVTGLDWTEFAFGLYTGDLVSHDLWELTQPYVEQEEMESYQEFFNGMGGVTLYPTLG